MSCIVYQTNKKTGITYAYESVSYWDKEKKQPRSKRQYIGRVDPETGEIIRKQDKGTRQQDTSDLSEDNDRLQALLDEKDTVIASLKEEIENLEKELSQKKEAIEEIKTICGRLS